MKFRTRMLVTFLLGALVPMTALALLVRQEMTGRLTAQAQQRVDAMAEVITDDLARQTDDVHAALAQVRDAIASDNRFRRAAVDGVEGERRYLLDYAGNAMRLAGLSMLQIQDSSGRIVSSGHFRNDYDRLEPELPRFLGALPHRAALVRARTAAEPMLVLASIDTVVVGRAPFSLVGGVEARALDAQARGSALTVMLHTPGDSVATDSSRTIVRELPVPLFDAEARRFRMAAFRISGDLSDIQALRRNVDRWFLLAFTLTALVIIVLASWLASRVSKPVVELAESAARIDLDRLNVRFDTDRSDEIGTLSKGLNAMTARLRDSASQLKEAERRAAMGDLARQVNHDIKNGLTPIRNVFRHLTQQAKENPAELPGVLQERQSTLDESMAYLEKLASNYARLSQRGARQRCDLNDVVRQVAEGARGAARVETLLGASAMVDADPVSLRRIVENLVENAIDSLNGRGSVTVETEMAGPRVRLIVSDTGAGMNDLQRARIFDDFYTTKPDGSGLGLSIVRRLVMDLDGSIKAESEPGYGSRFTVELPAASGKEEK